MAENILTEPMRAPADKGRRPDPTQLKNNAVERLSTEAAKRIAGTISAAIKDKGHWRREETRERLQNIVLGNEQIGEDYKEQLFTDIAEVIGKTPDAMGLTEATLRGPKLNPAVGTVGKLGTGTGYAYEIMGTAELIRKTSFAQETATNKAKMPLRIRDIDRCDHGIKFQGSYMDDERKMLKDRKTIEGDILIYRPDTREEVAVDFKHVKDHKTCYLNTKSEVKLREQLAGVVNSLNSGEIHEYHFATNGCFDSKYIEAVDDANAKLNPDTKPISLHNYVIASGLLMPDGVTKVG